MKLALSLRTKVFFLFSLATLLTVVPALVLIAAAVEERVYERATRELMGASDALRTYWRVQDEALLENARRLALEPGVAELMRDRDTTRLRRQLRSQVSRGREIFAADSVGERLVGPPLAPQILHGGSHAGSVVTFAIGDGEPIRVVVWPVWTDSGRVGVIGIGSRLSTETLRDLKEATGGAEVALAAADSILGSTLPDSVHAAAREIGLSAMRERGGVWLTTTVPYLGRSHLLPTEDPGGAAILLLRPVAQELQLARSIEQSVVGIGLAALLVALLIAVLVARIVARPVQALAEATEQLAKGNYGAPLPRASGDEIGQLTNAFGEMRSAIAEREARLRSAQAELIHREKLAAMGRLVAQLSHEINNPIYNIQNCLEVLERRGDPNDPNREFLELAQEELSRMAQLIRQLLDQSRPLSEAARPVSLNQLARRVVLLAKARIEERGVSLEMGLAPGLPDVVAHPDAMQQVLSNLVENALDAMPAGGTLRITSRADAEAVELVIHDTGTGIADEDLPHIFDAFYTTKPGIRGVGLGLFVSEGIVRGHRGRLSAESVPGEGSRFVIRLPRQTLDPNVSSETSESAA